MADYEFRYAPLTGRLTGKQMIEQTEQAINGLANLVDDAAGQVEIISTLANEANENAATALETAEEALATTGRTYITVSIPADANDYYDSQLIYIADSTSTNIPVADTGMLEAKTNDNKTVCEQCFVADSSGEAYYRNGAITAETVGDVTTYTVTWGGWSSEPASRQYVQEELLNYLPLAGGTLTGALKFSAGSVPIELQTTGTDYRDIQTSSTDGSHRIGVIRMEKDSSSNCKVTIGASNTSNAAPSGITISRGTSGNPVITGVTPTATDNSTKLATTAFVKENVPASIGSAKKPVYTDSNGKITASNGTEGGTQRPVYLNAGTITACTATGSAGGLEGVDSLNLNTGTNRTGWIRYESGLQICWTMAQMTNSGYTWTFPKAFTAIPVVQVTTSYAGSFSGTNAQRLISWAGNESTTNCKIYSNTDATSNIYKGVIAIGKWN